MRLLSRALILSAALSLPLMGASCTSNPTEALNAPLAENVTVETVDKVGEPTQAPDEAKNTDETKRVAPDTALPGAAADIATKFRSWGVVHQFLGAKVVSGAVVSATEAISFTKDNHVGVTTDGGNSWSFIKFMTGQVTSVAGKAGGPYVAGGKKGYMAISTDGKMWRDLPRHMAVDIIGVAVNSTTIVALGKKGNSVRYDTTGKKASYKPIPDGFSPKGLLLRGQDFIAWKGKDAAYKSRDGLNWTALPTFPKPEFKAFPTSKGLCKVGKVGKKKGVVCEVTGIAHGVTATVTAVDQKKSVAFTKDGGNNWAVAALPFKGVSTVIGAAAGPYYALGKGVAVTTDGRTWQPVNLNVTKKLNAGLIDGSVIVLVGDGGTIARSADNGKSWAVLPPVGGSLKAITKKGGKLIAWAGSKAIESADGGKTWAEVADPAVIEGLGELAKPGVCEGRLPKAAEACKYKRQVTTPLGLPKVVSMAFNGDVGLALGDAGLVAFTADGGASWKARSGFELKRGVYHYNVKGSTILAIGGKNQIVVSLDAGKTYKEAQLPPKTKNIRSSYIDDSGTVFLGGDKGTILRADGQLTNWVQLSTYPKDKASYARLFKVNNVLYAAGYKGELVRSQNQGQTWLPLVTGDKLPVVAMTGEGSTVLALVSDYRKDQRRLLRSDDNGLYFFVQRGLSQLYGNDWFELKGGKLTYGDMVSADFGAMWTPANNGYKRGTIDIKDGSGTRIRNYWRGRKAKPQFTVFGKEKTDYALVESFYNYGAWFKCSDKTGCFMISSGQVYRPQ